MTIMEKKFPSLFRVKRRSDSLYKINKGREKIQRIGEEFEKLIATLNGENYWGLNLCDESEEKKENDDFAE